MLDKLKQTIDNNAFSGVITIMKNNEYIINEAYGFRDIANELPNTCYTKFGIASGTKIFTAIGIMSLIDQGRLSLDTKVFDLIKKPFASYDDNVTIKHLLSHTSGLPDYYDEDLIDDFDNFTIETPWYLLEKPSDYLPSMPDREMKFTPGEGFNYNNGAFVLLAVIIEKLTGDYHQYIHDLFKDFEHTGFYRFDQLPGNTANSYIKTDQGWKTNIYNLPIIGGGDGGIFTNTYDLIKMWQTLNADGFISHELTKEMIDHQVNNVDGDCYGLGIWLDKDDKQIIVGSDAGISFYSCYQPSKNLFINVLSNTSDGVWDILKSVKELAFNL